MNKIFRAQRALQCLLLVFACTAGIAVAERDKIGLVLAGGGARGIAHAGVIKALEEMRIPVDAIAGTSMGALVGGLYATGMDAEGLDAIISNLDWSEAFEDAVERNDRSQRRKGDDYDYPTKIRLTFDNGKLKMPLGLVQGQQVRQMIKGLVERANRINNFDQLPIPFRAVATDIETGAAYVFKSGELNQAMRASMSIPGLLAPVEHDGRLLVDGGMAMNIPVEVGRSMGADRLIVVDIGTPLLDRNNINSVLDVTSQTMGFLTRKNSLEQLALVSESDVLINPQLGPVGMLDFDQAEVVFQLGYDAAIAKREELAVLSVDESTWQHYLATRTLPDPGKPIIRYVDINNNGPVNDELIRVRISQPIGETLDRDELLHDIETIYALDYWEFVDFEITSTDGDNGLLITARDKSWGKEKLKPGFTMASDLDGNSEINFGASYLRKGVTDLGGEFYSRVQLGDTNLFLAEFYQPLDPLSRFFVEPLVGLQDHEVLTVGPEYGIGDPLGSWRVRRVSAELNGGVNLFDNVQVQLGLFRNWGEYEVDRSASDGLPEDSFNEGGAVISYRYDSLDSAFFPTSGSFVFGEYSKNLEALGADEDFERWLLQAQTAFNFGAEQDNTLIFTTRLGQHVGAPNEPQNYYQMGGLFNLSGYGHNAISGRQSAFFMGQYQRRLSGRTVVPVDFPVYLGASIEGGQLWSEREDMALDDLRAAGSIYLAIDTPVGPIYVAYGHAQGSQDAIYLSLGWPFMSNQWRYGR